MDQPIQRYMIKVALQNQKNNKIKRYFLLIFMIWLAACSTKPKEDLIQVNEITQDSLQKISKQWKEDSLGCSRLRDPKKIRHLISQLKLIGKDSSLVIDYLGNPNGKNITGDTSVFYYYMSCGINQNSSYNFYCNFKGKELFSVQSAILN
jgi:hypothetical protein